MPRFDDHHDDTIIKAEHSSSLGKWCPTLLAMFCRPQTADIETKMAEFDLL